MASLKYSLVLINTVSLGLSPHQKTFNQLTTKVKSLKIKEINLVEELDRSLQFYYEKIRPQEDALVESIAERIKVSYLFYKNAAGLSKSECKKLKNLILDDLDTLYAAKGGQISAEIKEILNDLQGFSDEEIAEQVLEEQKNTIKQMCEQFGIDIDLSTINENSSIEDIMHELFERARASAHDDEETYQEVLKKKKPGKRALKRQAFEEMQKKSINTIYKKLARVVHPDLEMDNERKAEKERLMQKLTEAYKSGDLCTLLTLETEWLHNSAEMVHVKSEEQLELYNAVLKDQIRKMEASLYDLVYQPKYSPIQRYYGYRTLDGISGLKMRYQNLQNEVKSFQELVAKLQTSEALSLFKSAIKEYRAKR